MKLDYIKYTDLTAKQKERYNFQKLAGILADYGYSCIKLDDDWQAADFLAQDIDRINFYKVQLKGRLTFDKKYQNKSIYISFPYHDNWYIFEHDKLLEIFINEFPDKMAKSVSWNEGGNYSWNRLSQRILHLIEPYKLTPLRNSIDMNDTSSNDI